MYDSSKSNTLYSDGATNEQWGGQTSSRQTNRRELILNSSWQMSRTQRTQERRRKGLFLFGEEAISWLLEKRWEIDGFTGNFQGLDPLWRGRKWSGNLWLTFGFNHRSPFLRPSSIHVCWWEEFVQPSTDGFFSLRCFILKWTICQWKQNQPPH